MSQNPTASSLERTKVCTGSAVLPCTSHGRDSNPFADAGTGLHAYIMLAKERGREFALAQIPEDAKWKERAELIDLEQIPHGDFEVAYSFDVIAQEARELGRHIGRNYGNLFDTEIPGTADIVWQDDGTLTVDDIKTGHDPVTPPGKNLQVGHNVVSALLTTPPEERSRIRKLRTGIVTIGPDGEVFIDRAEIDSFRFDEIVEDMRSIWNGVQEARVRYIETGHVDVRPVPRLCRYCPCVLACPAHVDAVKSFRQVLTDPAAAKEQAAALETLELADVGTVGVMLDLAETHLAQIRAAYRNIVTARGPVPRPDGTESYALDVSTDRVDTDAAIVLLTKTGIDPAEIEKRIERKLAKGEIVELLKIHANAKADAQEKPLGKKQRSSFVNDWIEKATREMREARALKVGGHTQIRERKAKP